MTNLNAASQSLLHFLWQGALLGFIAAVGLRILSTRLRYGFALAMFCSMTAAPVATFLLLRSLEPAGAATDTIRVNPPSVESVANTAISAEQDWAPVILALWLAGVSVMALRAGGGWLVSKRKFGGGRQASEAVQAAAKRIAEQLGIRRAVRIAESITAQAPCVFGALKPILLLPAAAIAGLPAAQLEAILAHELAHIARHDFLVNCFQCVVEAVLFYHPAVWWLSRRIREEREMCCDAVAAEICGSPVLYSRALLALEESRQPADNFALAATGGNLQTRIERLLGMESTTRKSSAPAIAAALLAVVTMTVVVRAQAPAPLDSPYRNWVTEDVVYIITPGEKKAFESLRSNPERERFIGQFWERRDPTPDTEENEAKEEHYRRIAYSNERYSNASRDGWTTDRGRIYIVHGPPDEIESHPAEKRDEWHYKDGREFEFRGDEYKLIRQKPVAEARTVLFARIDVNEIAEPWRGQLRKELESFSGLPMSNALMDQMRAVQQRIHPNLVTRWSYNRTAGTTSLKLSHPDVK